MVNDPTPAPDLSQGGFLKLKRPIEFGGETIRELLPRELREEAGAELRAIGRLVGVFSRPDRDLRFHGVTVVVTCEVEMPSCR